MAVVKIIELVGSSTTSSDDAVQNALNDAKQTLRNIKAVDVVSTGLRGEDLNEWRAHVRVAFLIERVRERLEEPQLVSRRSGNGGARRGLPPGLRLRPLGFDLD